MADRPLPRAVLGWPREDQERFCEMAGKRMSDGADVEAADADALAEMLEGREG